MVTNAVIKSGVKHFTAYILEDSGIGRIHDEVNNYGRILRFQIINSGGIKLVNRDEVQLTSIEGRILRDAYNMGHFEILRKITLEDLARLYSISRMAIDLHLRSAIKKLIQHYLNTT